MKSVDCIDDLKIVQPILYNIIKNSLDFKKISHAYLIEVPTSYNKIEIGLALSKSIICSYNRTDSCNNCNICKMIFFIHFFWNHYFHLPSILNLTSTDVVVLLDF